MLDQARVSDPPDGAPAPPRGVTSKPASGGQYWTGADTSNVAIEFEGGTLGYHFGTWGARGTKLGYSFQAHCTEGMLEIDFRNGKLLGHKNVRGEERMEGRTEVFLTAVTGVRRGTNQAVRAAVAQQSRAGELAHFLDCIETGAKPLTDGPGSLQGLRLIWCLYEAEQNGVVADLHGLGLDEHQG